MTTASPATGRALGLARVLVLSASADGGHVRAAQAVERALRQTARSDASAPALWDSGIGSQLGVRKAV